MKLTAALAGLGLGLAATFALAADLPDLLSLSRRIIDLAISEQFTEGGTAAATLDPSDGTPSAHASVTVLPTLEERRGPSMRAFKILGGVAAAALVVVGDGERRASVEAAATAYACAGYGHGHRVALLLELEVRFALLGLVEERLGIAPCGGDSGSWLAHLCPPPEWWETRFCLRPGPANIGISEMRGLRVRPPWEAPAGPAHWLDNNRIAFRGDDDGIACSLLPVDPSRPASQPAGARNPRSGRVASADRSAPAPHRWRESAIRRSETRAPDRSPRRRRRNR